MKIKNIIIYNIILLVVMFTTAQIVTYQLTGGYIFQNKTETNLDLDNKRCTNKPLVSRGSISDPQLKALVEYEEACQSAFVDYMMVFSGMPMSTQNAYDLADSMTLRLRQFSASSVKPMIVVEPDTEWGLVDFHEYTTGFYDLWINDYFTRLKSNGIRDDQMGIWIPFPEPQQDFWNNNEEPDDFARCINKYFKVLRSVFPTAETAILLDSQTGEENQAPQLLAYTQLIEDGLVDYAGIQGFPWHPREEGDTRKSVIVADKFLPSYLAIEVAQSLGVNKIILNTGSYRHKKADSGGSITITSTERKQTLDSIFSEVSVLRDLNYDVVVNIFSENKLDTKEGVDWSYWQPDLYSQSDHKMLFTDFVHNLVQNNVKISLYDTR